jgi:hypothetical protein
LWFFKAVLPRDFVHRTGILYRDVTGWHLCGYFSSNFNRFPYFYFVSRHEHFPKSSSNRAHTEPDQCFL